MVLKHNSGEELGRRVALSRQVLESYDEMMIRDIYLKGSFQFILKFIFIVIIFFCHGIC